MHRILFFLAGLAAMQAGVVQSLPWPISLLERQDQSNEEQDVTDLDFVRKWAAIGDSYSAGIGSGSKLSDSGSCGRYDNSYPMMLQRYDEMPTNPAPTMDYLACSGATSPQILNNQISKLGTGYDLITLSSGGNDVGLIHVLNKCIYQWFSLTGDKGCDDQLDNTEKLIKDTLPGNFDKLTAGLKGKLNANRKVFWTGYARFFDDSTTDCDKATWSFWFNVLGKQFLTQARRQRMNKLVIGVNDAIKAAIERAGPDFVFVDYDHYFTQTQGRFCEGSTKEPDANRDGLLFFEWDTDNGITTLTRRSTDEPDPDGFLVGNLIDMGKRQDNSSPSGNETSFEDQIASFVREAKTANNSLEVALHDNSGADPAYRGRGMLSINDFIPDTILRVFHPQPAGHAIITNLLVWHITEQQAILQNVPWGPERGTNRGDSCALPLPMASPGASPTPAAPTPNTPTPAAPTPDKPTPAAPTPDTPKSTTSTSTAPAQPCPTRLATAGEAGNIPNASTTTVDCPGGKIVVGRSPTGSDEVIQYFVRNTCSIDANVAWTITNPNIGLFNSIIGPVPVAKGQSNTSNPLSTPESCTWVATFVIIS